MNGKWVDLEQGTRALRAYAAQPPRGSGPGVLLLPDAHDSPLSGLADVLSDEGYTVLMPADAATGLEHAVAALRSLPTFKGLAGAVGFGSGGTSALRAAAAGLVECAVSYYAERASDTASGAAPTVIHRAASATAGSIEGSEIYGYPGMRAGFATPGHAAFDRPASDMAYTRTLALLRRVLGPYYDLSALWEAHRRCEFETRDADATMATMVAQPYVNHIPTLTGGYGHTELHRFYKHHFIPKSPKDARNIPISRTVGADRIVNEGVLCFTHDCEIDWMLPGVPPTGRYVEVALVGIVTFRGDKLIHEHIYWDQASVLVQIGLLDPQGLPVAGIESAKKVLDPGLPSNALMKNWSRSAPA